jgi:hypothetical protein
MRNRILTVAALAGGASTLALAGGLTSADATRTVTIASHISIKSSGAGFAGKVSASNSACDGARKVTLYRTPSLVLGSTTTSASGSWKIAVQGSAGISLGHFYAKAKRLSQGAAGTIYICSAAKSPTVPF